MLIILVVLVAALGGLAVWQRHNLKGVYTAMTTTTENLEESVTQVREEHQTALAQQQNIHIQAPSLEQTQALLNGQATPQEVLEQLGIAQTGQTEAQTGTAAANPAEASSPADPAAPAQTNDSPESPAQAADDPAQDPAPAAEPAQTPDSPAEEPQPADSQSAEEAQSAQPQDPVQALVEQCVAELYACEVDLMSQLGGLKQAALDEWRSLDVSEQTQARKTAIAMNGLNQCYALESVADARVQGILDRYRAELTAIGADTAVMDQLWQYYLEEKESMKAYYLNQYL